MKWLDIHTHHGETVAVPDVKGMTVDEAAKMFRNHGLVYVISDTNYVKDKAAGIILELKPGVGEKVKEGRTVYLTVNTLDVLCVLFLMWRTTARSARRRLNC